MAAESIRSSRVCSKCLHEKSIDDFGYTRAVAGRKILRAQCRACYNTHRRLHYARPDVRPEKIRKRKAYQSRPEVIEARRAFRAKPETKKKERAAVEKWRSKPEVKARLESYRIEYVSKPETKALYLFGAIKLRAKKKKLPFDLTLEWISERVLSGRCQLTGLPFDYSPPRRGWRYNPSGPSVDQIAAGAGYTKANCRVILTSLNNALSQYGDEYFAKVAKAFLLARGHNIDSEG